MNCTYRGTFNIFIFRPIVVLLNCCNRFLFCNSLLWWFKSVVINRSFFLKKSNQISFSYLLWHFQTAIKGFYFVITYCSSLKDLTAAVIGLLKKKRNNRPNRRNRSSVVDFPLPVFWKHCNSSYIKKVPLKTLKTLV